MKKRSELARLSYRKITSPVLVARTTAEFFSYPQSVLRKRILRAWAEHDHEAVVFFSSSLRLLIAGEQRGSDESQG
ncbi:hypothetical protein [Pelagibius sp. Alg239-R121]|uniref:hypothetical protein n=1 Tax=Pelagibius sp. Alg239-R121 TaxID=2993448 RepID=UPI0024A74584|nr:hypothetical protein [Pelagibius sp. Alg239-R121]